jgi:hypothetical protein
VGARGQEWHEFDRVATEWLDSFEEAVEFEIKRPDSHILFALRRAGWN